MTHALIKIQAKGSATTVEFLVIDFIDTDIVFIDSTGKILKRPVAEFNKLFTVTSLTVYEVENAEPIQTKTIWT